MKKERVISTTVLALLTALLLVTILTVPRIVRDSVFEGRDARCAIQLGRYDDTTRGLITGYNYHLLKTLAADEDIDIDIILARRGDDYTDSLKRGGIDLLILPAAAQDSALLSLHMDSLVWWVMRDDDPEGFEVLERWMKEFQGRSSYLKERTLFLDVFNNPYNVVRAGIVREHLSPYDSLFRHWADTLGWDWRLLAAVAYQESKFRIDARSHMGARGLMQIMESTGKRFSLEDPYDPGESVRVGARYLKRLQDMFMSQARTREDLRKFSLAAYNAGQGSIKNCIHYAQYAGIESDTWESIKDNVLPLFAQGDTVCLGDSVRYPPFRVSETLNYVEDIYSLYAAFSRIVE